MSKELAREYLRQHGVDENRIIEFEVSTATVELAAQALGTEGARIAKSLSFMTKDGPVIIVAAGDTRVDNPAYKAFFGCKASMLPREETEALIGHAPGGVCPFGVRADVNVYLDVSLQRFATVYPACGSANNCIEMTPEELFSVSGAKQWIDVCKGWRDESAE